MSKPLISFADIVLDKKVGQSPLFLKLYKMDLRELSLFLKQEILANPLLDLNEIENYDYSQSQVDLVWDGKICRVNKVFCPKLKLKSEYQQCAGDFFAKQRKRRQFLQNILSSREKLLQKVGKYLCEFQWESWQKRASFSPLAMQKLAEDLQISKNICYALLKNKQVDFVGEVKLLSDFLVKGQAGLSLDFVKEKVRRLTKEGFGDREIAEQLQQMGVKISRRTVCKYRHQLS